MEKIKSLWARVRSSASKKLAALKAFLRGTSKETVKQAVKAAVKSVGQKVKSAAVSAYRWFMSLKTSDKVLLTFVALMFAFNVGVLGFLATLLILAQTAIQFVAMLAVMLMIAAAVDAYRRLRAPKTAEPATIESADAELQAMSSNLSSKLETVIADLKAEERAVAAKMLEVAEQAKQAAAEAMEQEAVSTPKTRQERRAQKEQAKRGLKLVEGTI